MAPEADGHRCHGMGHRQTSVSGDSWDLSKKRKDAVRTGCGAQGSRHPCGSGCRAASFPAASQSDRSLRAHGDSRPRAAPSAHKRPRSPLGAVSLRGQQAAERRAPDPLGNAHGGADTAFGGTRYRVAPPRGEPSAAPCPRCHPDGTTAGEHRVPPASHRAPACSICACFHTPFPLPRLLPHPHRRPISRCHAAAAQRHLQDPRELPNVPGITR